MIRKSLVLFYALIIFGCSYGQNYLKNPEMIIRDPHFTEYKKNRDSLELEYVRKTMTYAEYIKQRDHLDNTYAREVQERDAKIISPE